ncbi:MAG: ion transporter [bacterium]
MYSSRIFRILQLEDFIVAFQKLDNVYRASRDAIKATGLMALIIWVGCGALFFIFENDNPNFRECTSAVPLRGTGDTPGCYDFSSTAECNAFYGDNSCTQVAFKNMPDSLYYTAVFLCGEWGVVDFTWAGRLVCMFMCVAGIALYAIPTGTLFESFGNVLGMSEVEDDLVDAP